jgi:hypothetical protein
LTIKYLVMRYIYLKYSGGRCEATYEISSMRDPLFGHIMCLRAEQRYALRECG